MTRNRGGGLLAQIQDGVVDYTVPVSSLLQSCIVLGAQAGSEKMRDWARRELHGYADPDDAPDYRRAKGSLNAMLTNMAGYNGQSTRIDPSVLPQEVRDTLRDSNVDPEEVILWQGIGELEALARQETAEKAFLPSWSSFMTSVLGHQVPQGTRVVEVYLSVQGPAVENVLVRVRTTLAEMVAELIALTPPDQEVPDKQAADQVTQFVITGDRSVINYIPQRASAGGVNTAVAGVSSSGPVAVSSGSGSAVGSQTASGANSSVTGSQDASGQGASVAGGQSVMASRDAAGHDVAVPAAAEPAVEEGWWARLRKRGAVVAFAIVIGSIAAVAAVVVAIALAAGWKP